MDAKDFGLKRENLLEIYDSIRGTLKDAVFGLTIIRKMDLIGSINVDQLLSISQVVHTKIDYCVDY